MNRKVAIYTVLVAASIGLWLFMHSETAQIRRMFSLMERIARREHAEPVLESMARAQTLAGFFKDGCSFIAPEFGARQSVSREGIAGAAMNLRTGAKDIVIRFRELDIKVTGTQAHVKAWMDVAGTGAESFPFPLHPRKFVAELEKMDGKWLVSRVEIPQSQDKESSL